MKLDLEYCISTLLPQIKWMNEAIIKPDASVRYGLYFHVAIGDMKSISTKTWIDTPGGGAQFMYTGATDDEILQPHLGSTVLYSDSTVKLYYLGRDKYRILTKPSDDIDPCHCRSWNELTSEEFLFQTSLLDTDEVREVFAEIIVRYCYDNNLPRFNLRLRNLDSIIKYMLEQESQYVQNDTV